MIIKGIKERREFPNNILWSAAFLTIVGLIVLRSISQHSDDGFFQNPFLKQILFLLPAVLLCLTVYYTPRFLIHKYAYNLYIFGLMIIILPFFFLMKERFLNKDRPNNYLEIRKMREQNNFYMLF